MVVGSMQLSKVLKTVTLDLYTLPNDFCIRSVNLASRKTTVIMKGSPIGPASFACSMTAAVLSQLTVFTVMVST